MGRAHRLRGEAGRKRDGRLPIRLDQGRLEQGRFDPLTLAGLEPMSVSGDDPERSEDASRDVREGRTALGGRSTRPRAREAHDAAHGLRHEVKAAPVLVRARAAEAGERAVNQAGIVWLQILVAEAEPLHDARPEVLDQNVRLGR
jgi:hypothetical protein